MPKNSKHLAVISLAIMGAGFAATLPFQESLPIELLQGGFEAGVVGGLADWFAVTALFRHPMGIPIPHTALLPKNRDRMIGSLVSTLENDWLSKESIQDKMKQIQFMERLLPFFEKEIHSPAVKKGMTTLLKEMIFQVDLEKLLPFIKKELKGYLSSCKVEPLLQMVVNQSLARKYDEKMLDLLLVKAEEWVKKDNQQYQLGRLAIGALDSFKLDGIMQFALNSFRSMVNEEKLGNIIQNLLINVINSLRETDNLNRENILESLHKQVKILPENKELLEELENVKTSMVENWEPADQIREALQSMHQKLLAIVEDGTMLDSYVLPGLTNLLNNFKEDEEKKTMLESLIQNQVSSIIRDNHSKIGNLVKENLDKLDTETLIDMVENNIGKDLQWIRVNGAVCGFFIGLILTGIKTLF